MGTATPSKLKYQEQKNEYNFNIDTFTQMIANSQFCNGQGQKLLNQFQCMRVNHAEVISFVCINPICQAQNRKCCTICFLEQLHDGDDHYDLKFMATELQIEQIIQQYKQDAQKQMDKICLYILLIELQIIDENDKFIKQEIENKNNNLKQRLYNFQYEFNRISLQDFINQLQGNPNLYDYLRHNYQILIELQPSLVKYYQLRMDLLNNQQQNEIQVNEQNQWQREKVRKCKLDLLCKILKSRIYLEGEIDYEQSQIIKSQFEMMLNIGIEYADENNFNAAFQICDIICEQNKYNQQAYLKKGIILDKQKKYEEAFMKKLDILQVDWGQKFKYESL